MDLAKDLIMAFKKNNKHSGYGLQKECEALVGHVLNNMVKSKMPTLIADVKNNQDSTKFREEGNQCFVTGDDEEAIEKYTMSLAYAPTKESMALALANRSAALYRKKLYRECIIDIDAALSHGYPEEKKNKLKERAEKAIDGLTQLTQITDQNMNNLPSKNTSNTESGENGSIMNKDFSLIKEFIKNDKTDTETKKQSVDELMALGEPKPIPRYLIEEHELSFAYGPSEEAPAVSKGVKIAYNQTFGRHLVASQNFKPGSIIAMEKPFSHIIYRERMYTHCHHCLARNFNLIPCSKCPLALYCSENCKNLSWKMAHKTECTVHAVMSKLLNVDADKIKMLTKIIRLLIIATKNGTAIDELRQDALIAEKNPDNRTAGFTDDHIFDSTSARSALSLATNLDTRPFIDISAFACISALATILLATETKFFGKKYRPNDLKNIVQQDNVRYCGTIIFRSCVIVSSNTFSVQQEPGVKTGSGLYNTHSLLNHSCAPNTFRHFDGMTMITRALEPIKEGDQIFTCYGGGYQYMARGERKSNLRRDYYFDCNCIACIEDWPTYAAILKNHVGSVAKTNKKLVDKLKPYRQRLMSNKYDIDAVKSVLDILYAEAKMPCEEIVHAIQYLKSYYLDP